MLLFPTRLFFFIFFSMSLSFVPLETWTCHATQFFFQLFDLCRGKVLGKFGAKQFVVFPEFLHVAVMHGFHPLAKIFQDGRNRGTLCIAWINGFDEVVFEAAALPQFTHMCHATADQLAGEQHPEDDANYQRSSQGEY